MRPGRRRMSCIRGLLVLGLAMLHSSPCDAEDARQRSTITFDGDVIGDASMSPDLDHGGWIWDPVSGGLASRTTPAFDGSRSWGMVGPWKESASEIQVASVVASGWSRDQTQRRLAIYDRGRGRLSIWHGDQVTSSPDVQFEFRRSIEGETVFDALVNTSFERENETFRVTSATMLPGCVLLLLERTRWATVEGTLVSLVEGVSVGSLQETSTGDWEWTTVQDMPDPPIEEALAYPRGSLSSMASYYPTSRAADFREAFVPLVDYMNHQAESRAVGGQCGIVRVRRQAVGDSWTIDPLVEIASSWGTVGEHFHVAGWTPAGVVLAVGDSELSRVSLLRCSDWDRYDDLDVWTEIPRWQGTLPDGALVSCNQFWSCCAGNHDHELLVGGDNVAGTIFGLEVPVAEPTPPIFNRLLGVQGARLANGTTANTASWMMRDRPETNGPVLARMVLDGINVAYYSRILHSPDGRSFGVIGRLPEDVERLAVPFFFGKGLGLHRFNLVGSESLWTTGLPDESSPQAGLEIRPGGFDLLRDESGAHRAPDSLDIASGVKVVRLASNEIPAGGDLVLPPDAICYRVTAQNPGSATRLLTAQFLDPRRFDGLPPASATVVTAMIRNLASAKLRLRFELTRGTGSTEKTHTIASTDDWNTVDVWSFRNPIDANCSLRVDNRGGDPTSFVDFLMVFRSVSESASSPAWHLDPAPGRVVSGDRLDVPLPIRTDEWSVAVDLMLPDDGIDYSVGSIVPSVPVLSLRDGAGRSLTLDVRPGGGEWRLYRAGNPQPIAAIGSMHLNREDPIRIRLCREGDGIVCSIRVAGDRGPTIASMRTSSVVVPRPTLLRMGGPEGQLNSSWIVRRVEVETPTSPGGVRPVLVNQVPTPAVSDSGRGRRSASVPGTVDIFEIASRLGQRGVDLPRTIDLDGDSEVTLFDLEVAVRLGRSNVDTRIPIKESRPPAPAP